MNEVTSRVVVDDVPCGKCGYSLRGLGVPGACPECGTPIDLLCIQCGYNLRGIDMAGVCPECGTPINQLTRGDLLRYANPEWLRKVKLGLDLLYYGIGLAIVAGFAASGASAMFPTAGHLIMALLSVASSAFNLCAIFLITTQEPKNAITETGMTWRRVIRGAAVLGLVSQTVIQFGTPYQSVSIVAFAMLIALILAVLAGPVSTYGQFTYAHGFALRIPDHKLARSTNIVKWGLTILGGLGALAGMVVGAAMMMRAIPAPGAPGMSKPSGAGLAALVSAGCVVALASIVFSLWALRLLWRYRKALKQAVIEAKAQPTR